MTDAIFNQSRLPEGPIAHLRLVPDSDSVLPLSLSRALYSPDDPPHPLTDQDLHGFVQAEQSALPLQAITTVLLRCAGIDVDYTAHHNMKTAGVALERAVSLQALHLQPKPIVETKQRRRKPSDRPTTLQIRDNQAVEDARSQHLELQDLAEPYTLFYNFVKDYHRNYHNDYFTNGKPDTLHKIPELYSGTDELTHPSIGLLESARERLKHRIHEPERLLRLILLKTVVLEQSAR